MQQALKPHIRLLPTDGKGAPKEEAAHQRQKALSLGYMKDVREEVLSSTKGGNMAVKKGCKKEWVKMMNSRSSYERHWHR